MIHFSRGGGGHNQESAVQVLGLKASLAVIDQSLSSPLLHRRRRGWRQHRELGLGGKQTLDFAFAYSPGADYHASASG